MLLHIPRNSYGFELLVQNPGDYTVEDEALPWKSLRLGL